MERSWSLQFWSILGPNLPTLKPKLLLKHKISAKTASLRIINNISPRSQKNHRIPRKFSGPKCDLNCHNRSKGHHANSHIAYNRTSIYTFCMLSFSFWVFTIVDFSQKKLLHVFGSGPIWAHVWNFLSNNSSKQSLIEVVLIVAQISFKAFWGTQTFTVTGLTQSLSFWSNFDTNLPSKDGHWNQK